MENMDHLVSGPRGGESQRDDLERQDVALL